MANPSQGPNQGPNRGTDPAAIAIVHLLVRDDANGPIKSMGLGGENHGKPQNFYIACNPNQAKLTKFASGEAASTNCPLCLKTVDWQRVKLEQEGDGNDADLAAAKAMADQAAIQQSAEHPTGQPPEQPTGAASGDSDAPPTLAQVTAASGCSAC